MGGSVTGYIKRIKPLQEKKSAVESIADKLKGEVSTLEKNISIERVGEKTAPVYKYRFVYEPTHAFENDETCKEVFGGRTDEMKTHGYRLVLEPPKIDELLKQ